jgi:hypothetical protein
VIKIAFLGDISFNDDYIKLRKDGVNPFEKVIPLLKKQDVVVGNLECFVPGDEGENELKKPRLKTDIDTLNYLKELNISVVTLSNNHAFDHLSSGFFNTTSFLSQNNIEYLGASFIKEEAEKPILIERNNQKICFLSYLHEDTNPSLLENNAIFFNEYQKSRILNDIEKYKREKYFVVLLFHWGGRFEGGRYPDKYQYLDALEYVKKGADIIVGTHSHTLQPYEKKNGSYIFYSLGNFCFANIHSDGKTKKILNYPRYTKSSVLILTIKNNGDYFVEMIPIKNRELHIVPLKKFALLLPTLNSLYFRVFRNFKLFWIAYTFIYKHVNPYIKMLYTFNEISYVKKIARFFKIIAR